MFIKDLRQKRLLSQEELAERCSLSLRTIQRAECGNRIGFASMKSLAAELNIDFEILEQEITKMENTSSEYKELPIWLRLTMGSGWIAANRIGCQRLEAFFVVVGAFIFAVWIGNIVWGFATWLPERSLVFGLMSMLIGAYSMSLNIRLGDKYDVWSRLEATMPQKGVFGVGTEKNN